MATNEHEGQKPPIDQPKTPPTENDRKVSSKSYFPDYVEDTSSGIGPHF